MLPKFVSGFRISRLFKWWRHVTETGKSKIIESRLSCAGQISLNDLIPTQVSLTIISLYNLCIFTSSDLLSSGSVHRLSGRRQMAPPLSQNLGEARQALASITQPRLRETAALLVLQIRRSYAGERESVKRDYLT